LKRSNSKLTQKGKPKRFPFIVNPNSFYRTTVIQ
jgi:hypothetical protein